MSSPSSTTPVPDPAVLRGDGRYGFTARIEGEDLVVRGVRATWFGGAHDPQDDGETASGLSTRLHPTLLGCALPMNGHRVTRGSPLPNLPWIKTVVEVTRPINGKRVNAILIDLGPAAPPHAHAAIDLTLAAFHALGGETEQGFVTVDFRVPGGALRLPRDIFLAARSAAQTTDPIRRAAQAQGSPQVVTSTQDSRSAAPALRPLETTAGAAGALNPGLEVAAAATAPAGQPGTQDPAPCGTATGSAGRAVPPVQGRS